MGNQGELRSRVHNLQGEKFWDVGLELGCGHPRRNADDLDRFLAVALNRDRHLRADEVAGPFAIADSPKPHIGKVRTRSPFQ